MPRDYSFVFPLPNGLHARPASQLEEVTSRFDASIALCCRRNENRADARSVLSLISADVRHGDECVLEVSGRDEQSAFDALVHYLVHDFPHCDDALPAAPEGPVNGNLPRSLAALGVTEWLAGQPVSSGLAVAAVVQAGGLSLADGFEFPPSGSALAEKERFSSALADAHCELLRQSADAAGQHAEILRAQAGMIGDPSLAAQVCELVDTGESSAGEAVLAVTDALSNKLKLGSDYLRERVADLQDLAALLIEKLHGPGTIRRAPVLTQPSILAAVDLTPGQFLALDKRFLTGIALEHSGGTSHTSILARAAGIPLLGGVRAASSLPPGEEVILDARRGALIRNAPPAVSSFYQRELERMADLDQQAAKWRNSPSESLDGASLPMFANVASSAEVAEAIGRGAEGIGLFRTELLFMNRPAAPDENEQYTIYSEALQHAEGRPVVIRTLDIGGDKPVPYLNLPLEPNPFLGQRGIRLHGRLDAIIRTQLRALLRASIHGQLKIMVPMVACPLEMAEFRTLVEEILASLAAEGIPTAAGIPVGAMVEIPSAVFSLQEIARHADFFSVGSNDLAQYFLAADRDNPFTAELGTWKHPSFLRLLKLAVDNARAAGRPIGLCGDLAGRSEALPLLLALGFDSISRGAAGLPRGKMQLSTISRAASSKRLASALAASDRMALESLLSQPVNSPGPLAPELIDLDCRATSKAAAINELVALLEKSDRTSNAIGLEEAVWIREESYSTGFGHGFAVPHCKSPHLSGPAIALVRLRHPVEWGSLDGAPVRIVVLLAMPEGENRTHLKIFAMLSRLIMRDEFRNALETAPDAATVVALLSEALPQPDLESVPT